MEPLQKMQTIASQMHLELAEEAGGIIPLRPVNRPETAPCGIPQPTADQTPPALPRGKEAKRKSLGVFDAVAPGGKTIPLLKTMLTTACERDCHYCPFRAGRNYRRTTFKPAEMADLFMSMHYAGLVDGLFLSSGIIKGSVRTQDRLLETVDILRKQHRFTGYIHLKVMPGAEKAQLEKALSLADRLSVNLEAPTVPALARLAPMKLLAEELVTPLRQIEALRRETFDPRLRGRPWQRRQPSTATQFVVGAAGESDVDLLTAAEYLYHKLHLSRAYFSAFHPIADTPLAHLPPTPVMRQNRLYQASYLLRDYGFSFEELPFDAAGHLPLDRDPKLAWAQQHLLERPVELNRADREELLRVPGIGPGRAEQIIAARRRGRLRDLADLQTLGIATKRMAPFVLLAGRRPAHQLPLALF